MREYPILVVAALIARDGKILLERRAPSGVAGLDDMWDLPGGKVECGETPHDALIRELQEELTITVKPLRLLGLMTSTWVYPDGRKHWVIASYECAITAGEPCCGDRLAWRADLTDVLAPDAEIIREWALRAELETG